MATDLLTPPTTEPYLARATRILSGGVRPDDVLPVTPEVAYAVDTFVNFLRTEFQTEADEKRKAEYRSRMLISFHHPGVWIAYLETQYGPVVLAVGEGQVGEFVRTIPYEVCKDAIYTIPENWYVD